MHSPLIKSMISSKSVALSNRQSARMRSETRFWGANWMICTISFTTFATGTSKPSFRHSLSNLRHWHSDDPSDTLRDAPGKDLDVSHNVFVHRHASFFVNQDTFRQKKHEQSAVQDSIDSLIDVLFTQILPEDQIKDTREHAYSNNFSCHSRTHFQRHCDFTDCHPFFLSTPLITIPQPLLPLSLKLPSQKPRIAFHTVD